MNKSPFFLVRSIELEKLSGNKWQWDHNAFSVIFHIQPRFHAVVCDYRGELRSDYCSANQYNTLPCTQCVPIFIVTFTVKPILHKQNMKWMPVQYLIFHCIVFLTSWQSIESSFGEVTKRLLSIKPTKQQKVSTSSWTVERIEATRSDIPWLYPTSGWWYA